MTENVLYEGAVDESYIPFWYFMIRLLQVMGLVFYIVCYYFLIHKGRKRMDISGLSI